MGLLDRIRKRAFPAGEDFRVLAQSPFGHVDEFASEDYTDYLATSNDIYSIANFRARHAGAVPLKPYNGRGAEKKEVLDGPLPQLLRRANPFWTFPRLMRMTELSSCLWGESAWAVEKDGNGTPRELWWLRPTRFHPVPSEKSYIKGFTYISASGEAIDFAPDEVVWLRYPNPADELSGLSPLAAARLAADSASAMMKSNRNLFVNGLQPGGFIMPTKDKVVFSKEQAQELEEGFERRFKGADKAHRWGVLRFEAQVQPMPISQKDAEFIAGLNMTFRQACRAYGVPSPLLNDMEHATLANLRELDLTFWEHCMVPELDFYAAELEAQLLPLVKGGPDHVEWDYGSVPALQQAHTAIWDRYKDQVKVGALTINEFRAAQGLPPVAWGDVYWSPVNTIPISKPEDYKAGQVNQGELGAQSA